MYKCTHCSELTCYKEDSERIPANCPMRKETLMDVCVSRYDSPENREFHRTSSVIEAAGYCQWPRVREIIEFSKGMKYRKIGIAFCLGLHKEAAVVDRLLQESGFETVSVICKAGRVPKERIGIDDKEKVRPGTFETICNPIAQAEFLNEQETEFNIMVGLCVGHDSMFYKYSKAMVTTLIAKDRVLAHNPAGALYCAEGYFKSRNT